MGSTVLPECELVLGCTGRLHSVFLQCRNFTGHIKVEASCDDWLNISNLGTDRDNIARSFMNHFRFILVLFYYFKQFGHEATYVGVRHTPDLLDGRSWIAMIAYAVEI